MIVAAMNNAYYMASKAVDALDANPRKQEVQDVATLVFGNEETIQKAKGSQTIASKVLYFTKLFSSTATKHCDNKFSRHA
jgi:hypothetical protein